MHRTKMAEILRANILRDISQPRYVQYMQLLYFTHTLYQWYVMLIVDTDNDDIRRIIRSNILHILTYYNGNVIWNYNNY